ncbi:MAG: hydroxymethylglutaryl-CoA lyase [Robiginitomaculum sp.]|nr:hydroxymethylglutaryl-CoA lyase [Robiginitomaculum sp.]
MTTHIDILEVSPRDGLQSEKTPVSTADKLKLINMALDAGLKRIEITSFVNPKRVPQMADAAELVRALPKRDDVIYTGMVLNTRGFERAAELGMDEIGCVVVSTETFNLKNQGASVDETLWQWADMATRAKRAGMRAQITISCAFGCPYEGEIAPARIVEIAKRAADAEPVELCLADSIGVAVPSQVRDLLGMVAGAVPGIPLRAHLHNTRGTGLANALAAIEAGVQTLDASIGGIGGCPFAPRATGNIPTDDLVYMLERSGIKTGVSLAGIIETSHWLEDVLGRPVPSQVAQAGGFPKNPKCDQTVEKAN